MGSARRMGGAKRYPSIAVDEDDGFREGLNPSYRTDLPDGLFGSLPVQPCLQKHFRSRAPQIRSSTHFSWIVSRDSRYG